MDRIIERGELKNINKPARYVGGEVSQIIKNDAACSVVLCYPNTYEKAMSNHIVRLLYNNINMIDDVWCKRCFAVEQDFEMLLRNNSYDIYSLEDMHSIKDNDILIFVINNEMDYSNFINMLNLANIQLYKKTRNEESPKIWLWASKNLNINVIGDFADYIFQEDSDNASVKKMLAYIKEYVKNPEMDFANINTLLEDVEIKENVASIVPSIKIDNSSIIIDLATIQDMEKTIDYVVKCIKEQGITKVSFVNQDMIDEIKFCELVFRLKFNIDDIRILVKNIDFSRFSPHVLNILLPCMEKSSLKFDIGTCNKKLMNIISVGMDKEILLDKVRCVFKNGWSSLKLNFYIGLPNETYEDIDDIFNIAEKIVEMYAQRRAKEKLSLIININCYIPTTEEMNNYNVNSVNKLETKIRYINEKKHDAVIKFNIDSIDSYITKILLKNGEIDISKILVKAYELGARFDNSSRTYNKIAWDKAIYDNIKIINKYTKFN